MAEMADLPEDIQVCPLSRPNLGDFKVVKRGGNCKELYIAAHYHANSTYTNKHAHTHTHAHAHTHTHTHTHMPLAHCE